MKRERAIENVMKETGLGESFRDYVERKVGELTDYDSNIDRYTVRAIIGRIKAELR